MGILDFETPEELKKKEAEQKQGEKKSSIKLVIIVIVSVFILLTLLVGFIFYLKFVNKPLGDTLGATKGGNDPITDIVYKTVYNKEPEKVYVPEKVGVTEYVTTNPITVDKLSSCVVVAEKYCDDLKLATTTSGSKEIVANVPEGTKIYAPFDGNIIVSTSEIASYNVRPMRVYRVNSEKDEEIVSLSFLVQTWSDTIGNKTVKKGDYIGTIGKSAPILDSLSDIKGNNLCFSAVAAGFVKTQYNTPKDYIKAFIQFAEQFEVKKLDLNLRANQPVETPGQ